LEGVTVNCDNPLAGAFECISLILFHKLIVTSIFLSLSPESEAFHHAISKARDVYLFDDLDIFYKSGVLHQTTCQDANGCFRRCVIVPPPSREKGIEIMFEPHPPNLYFSHKIKLNDGKVCDRTRLMVKIKEAGDVMDPFHVRLEKGMCNYFTCSVHLVVFAQSVCVLFRVF
jgi:hypothetical protein